MIGALALAISTTVGAGVLGLPKALHDVGLPGLLLVFIPASAVFLLSMMLLDMLQKEKKPVQLPSLIADALGAEYWKYLVYLTLIFSMYGALAAYLIGFGEQTNVLLGVPPLAASLTLFVIGTAIVYTGTKYVEKLDVPMSAFLVLFLVVVGAVNLLNFKHVPSSSMPGAVAIASFLGVSLFALSSVNVLPEINYLAGKRARLVVLLNTLICVFLYMFFSLSTVGVLGDDVTGLGTKGLAVYYGGWFQAFISLFTLLALFSSFLGIGLSLRHVYNFDFNLSRKMSTALAILPPLLLFFLSKYTHTGFLGVLSIAGEVTLPLFSLIAIYAYSREYRKLETKTPFPAISIAYTTLFYLGLFLFSLVSRW